MADSAGLYGSKKLGTDRKIQKQNSCVRDEILNSNFRNNKTRQIN
jgi:hypothetical protein